MKWWHALNPIDADVLDGEKKTLRLRIALTIQLEELKDQLARLEARIEDADAQKERGQDG